MGKERGDEVLGRFGCEVDCDGEMEDAQVRTDHARQLEERSRLEGTVDLKVLYDPQAMSSVPNLDATLWVEAGSKGGPLLLEILVDDGEGGRILEGRNDDERFEVREV